MSYPSYEELRKAVVHYMAESAKFKDLAMGLLEIAQRIAPDQNVELKWEDAVSQYQKDRDFIEKAKEELK